MDIMTREVDAVYENGTLKLLGALPFAERQHVRVTVSGLSGDPLDAMIDHAFLERAKKEVAAAGRVPTHEDVRKMTASDSTSWADTIIAERADRF